MKGKKCKKCKTCGACKRLYRRFWYRYWPYKLHYCTVRGEIADEEGICEAWRQKKPEYDLSSERFDNAEADIKALMECFGKTDPELPRRSFHRE